MMSVTSAKGKGGTVPLTRVYKLTDQHLCTYQGYQWALGETRTFRGEGPLCGPGWAHAYTHPLLAILLNSIHANVILPRLFEADGVVGRTDYGLKVGCSRLTLLKEQYLPLVTPEHRVRFALVCAMSVYRHAPFITWAHRWLDNQDRTARAASVVAEMTAETRSAESEAAMGAVRAAVWAAVWAETRSAKWAVEKAAARAAERAARAAVLAADFAFDVTKQAETACTGLQWNIPLPH